MSSGNRLHQRGVETPQTEHDSGDVRWRVDERAEELSIGMYYRKAGTRDAGGVVMYVQELLDALSAHQSAYLYTENGELTPKMRTTDAEIVPLSVTGALDSLSSRVLPGLAETLVPLLGAIRDGTIRHMNETLDVLVTHNYLDDLVLSNLLDVPVVRVFHGFERTGLGTTAHGLLSDSYSIVNSVQTSAEFVEELGHEPDGIVYPGVDTDLFHPDAPPVFERDAPSVLFVGRFVESKGLFDLIDALAAGRGGGTEDVHLSIVGRGDREAVERRVEQHGLESSVTIVGSVPHDDLPGYYTAADVVCSPSHYESFGMVNMEAMACGTPVITTTVDGVTEYAIDRETALLVPSESPDAIADAIATAVDSPELRTRLATQGRAVAERYSWEQSSKRLADLCFDIVDGN
ncbi:glycosyl transferase group 1 [Haladaptatus sp. W1]|uniref:glycosyltransferase family 4 protein n=1 Tax=Haladaptatus sp. W1 TaxID=1897478 RepID=UPI000849B969|nr:glycosyltransferase family 4 protein [Haladaptatus sp. W1]ODR81887.1 glycosyl transferase group 1 [Haladaptatus sp. W1]